MKSLYKFITIVGIFFSAFLVCENTHAQENDRRIITNQEKTISVYPVPARTTAHIRLSPALKQDVDKIEIINLIGKKITEQTIIDKNASEIIFSNLGELPQGIYMIITRDKYGKILLSAKMMIDN